MERVGASESGRVRGWWQPVDKMPGRSGGNRPLGSGPGAYCCSKLGHCGRCACWLLGTREASSRWSWVCRLCRRVLSCCAVLLRVVLVVERAVGSWQFCRGRRDRRLPEAQQPFSSHGFMPPAKHQPLRHTCVLSHRGQLRPCPAFPQTPPILSFLRACKQPQRQSLLLSPCSRPLLQAYYS